MCRWSPCVESPVSVVVPLVVLSTRCLLRLRSFTTSTARSAQMQLPSDPFVRWQTLLKYFHDNLRSGIERLVQDSERDGAQPSPALIRSTRSYLRHLEGHHGIEDHAVFPVLATRMDVSKLQQDHAEMDTIIANIEQACMSKDGGVLQDALKQLRVLVLPHMLAEEESTTPQKLQAAGFTAREISHMV